MSRTKSRRWARFAPDGKLISETIWFNDLPVATIRPKGSSNQLPLGITGTGSSTANNTGANTSSNKANVELYYLHPNHLGTARVATRSQAKDGASTGANAVNKAVWRWDSDAFGTNEGSSKPDENPQQIGGTPSQITAASFRHSHRFPGQAFDLETNRHYNYFRDYNPSIGRYVESDPIGLQGGINTYVYVEGNPLLYAALIGLHKGD